MNKAKRLVVGDVVALVNPAGMPPERFRKFIPLMERYLQEEGFVVRSYLAEESAGAKDLAQKFTEAWFDPEVRAVFPVCGGDRIFEVITHISPQELAAKPVIFCGSSTLSSLSLVLNIKSGIVSFFGPHLPFIHTYAPQRETEFSVQSFWSMVMWKKGRTKKISSNHERHHFFSVRDPVETEVKMTNIYHQSGLIGDERRQDVKFFTTCKDLVFGTIRCATLGALLSLSRHSGISFPPGSIIFTETMDWTLDQVKNTFFELAKARMFTTISAIFLTALTERTDRKERLYPELRDEEKIKELCGFISDLLHLPVFYGFPLGHGAYKLTLPQGVRCYIDPIDGSVTLLEMPFI
jgi:muramoyltetrapeptide carboxypeptidase LdcA involved in peptidoglycan recycling